MSLIRLFAITALVTSAGSAAATSFVATTDAVGGAIMESSDVTSDISSSLNDDKIVRAARDDAAAFVASQGTVRGARLEAALQHIRQQAPLLRADDLRLAEAILTR